jgi:hypothetical protein
LGTVVTVVILVGVVGSGTNAGVVLASVDVIILLLRRRCGKDENENETE